MERELAVVTGASSGIGLELARMCARRGCDVLAVADDAAIFDTPRILATPDVQILPLRCDLAEAHGAEEVERAVNAQGRPVAALMANAGIALGGAFLDQDLDRALRVVHTNVDGTIRLVHSLGRRMAAQGHGRVLITGSIAGLMPGAFNAVYNGTKAFLDSFAVALSEELSDSGLTITLLLPGATATHVFERADMLDTFMGATSLKADPADVARAGYEAMWRGELKVVHGLVNKAMAAATRVVPDSLLAEMHRHLAGPKSRR